MPFAEGTLARPDRAFFIRATLVPSLDTSWVASLVCEQSLYAEYQDLKAAGFSVRKHLELESGQPSYPMGFCSFTKHKRENYGNVYRAWQMLEPGGTLVCVGHNDIGVKSIEKTINRAIPTVDRLTKNHCRVFWLQKDPDTVLPEEWADYSSAHPHIADTDYQTHPGVFSWNKVDKGSQFLIDQLPRDIKGHVADLGAGWGYLSHQVLERYPKIKQLDLYENEGLALEMAKTNLQGAEERAKFHWLDLAQQLPEKRDYDYIITNPPFHTSARTDVRLGCRFIEVASECLTRSGKLILVANRQLPYEREIKERFYSFQRIEESIDFKVLIATK